ncbi:ASCH domain-containing protein [Methanolobus psychrotolerans]|uniref:ASCH domain-containing protein n=1 Tax=Methanolobus psychrotolerans TaxID=1874706 RepID=UPI000B91B7F8|nr:ASCH domain-containing protein [Methanolobus psychrotolerans]
MKVLAVRQPWAALIAQGYKCMDIRSTDCHYRGPVAIYATRGNVRRKDKIYFKNILGASGFEQQNRGYLLCVADITGTIRFDTPEKFAAYSECHYCSPFSFVSGQYGWILSNVRELDRHIPYKMPKGCVNWSRVNDSVVNANLNQYYPVTQGVEA